MMRNPDRDLDLQLDRLTRTLRDTGISPERDLWPEIDQAIEQTSGHHAGLIRPKRSRRPAAWRIAALAASVLLLVGVGLVQQGGLPGRSADHQANQEMNENFGPMAHAELAGAEDPVEAMQAVDKALADLNRALAVDPDNGSLSRLVLMIHKSRGNLIRNTVRRLADPAR